MTPFDMSLVKLVAGLLGAAAVVHWVVREVKRANEELLREKAVKVEVRRESFPTLRRDPRTGEYRP